jgi:hypothetical protein
MHRGEFFGSTNDFLGVCQSIIDCPQLSVAKVHEKSTLHLIDSGTVFHGSAALKAKMSEMLWGRE